MHQDWRYERKFHTTLLDAKRLEHIIALHPYGFKRHFPNRIINNIYYDSEDLRAYRVHIEGSPERKKVRVRWYGDSRAQMLPVLEVKHRKGLLNRKERIDMDALVFESWQDLGFPIGEYKELRATLFNSYLRRYFISFDGKFRLTIDEGIKYCRPGGDWTADSNIVLELKYFPEDEDSANLIGQHLPVRLSKYSKYVSGINKTTL